MKTLVDSRNGNSKEGYLRTGRQIVTRYFLDLIPVLHLEGFIKREQRRKLSSKLTAPLCSTDRFLDDVSFFPFSLTLLLSRIEYPRYANTISAYTAA